jgi:3-methyladenine DNA glycosylase AlkD
MENLNQIKKDLARLKNPEKAKVLSGFFKTGKGEYGEGDKFLGIVVPEQRKIAKRHSNISLSDLQELLSSKIHECRLTALFILIAKYKKADEKEKKKIFYFYLKNTRYINNWDLVDLSAPKIVGEYLLDKNRKLLHKMATSKNLWRKRIAILATFAFIRNNDFKDTLEISKVLLRDKNDLIHKAVGWMLREVGKRDLGAEEAFLKKHYNVMPRTMLRYAIERFPEEKRLSYLKK